MLKQALQAIRDRGHRGLVIAAEWNKPMCPIAVSVSDLRWDSTSLHAGFHHDGWSAAKRLLSPSEFKSQAHIGVVSLVIPSSGQPYVLAELLDRQVKAELIYDSRQMPLPLDVSNAA